MVTLPVSQRYSYGSVHDFATAHEAPRQQPSGEEEELLAGRGLGARRIAIYLAIFCGLAIGAIAVAMRRVDHLPPTIVMEVNGRSSTLLEEAGVDADADDPAVPLLAFTALNLYHVRDGKPAQAYPWLKDVVLIEPHRETTLSVIDPLVGFEYRWKVREGIISDTGKFPDKQAAVTAVGAETVVTFTRLDEHMIVLEEVNALGEVTRRLEKEVMVKYVRREIRTLTDDEREELLDAVGA